MGARTLSIITVTVVLLAVPAALIVLPHTSLPTSSETIYGDQHSASNLPVTKLSQLLSNLDSNGSTSPRAGSGIAQTQGQFMHRSIVQSLSPNTLGTFSVKFMEFGLPTNTPWNVQISGSTYSTSNSTQNVSLPYGNYNYSYRANGYLPLSTQNDLFVNSSGEIVDLYFQSNINVNSTLTIINNTLISGNYVPPTNTTSAPLGVIFDPLNGETYVADSGLNRVLVLNKEGLITSSVNTGKNPVELAFDTFNGYLYVTNSGSNNVSAINSQNKIVGTFNTGQFPFGISYDPNNQNIYVANTVSNNVTVISTVNGGSGKVVGTIQFQSGIEPFSSLFDPTLGSVLFSNLNGNGLIEVTGLQFSKIIHVQDSPAMMAYDPNNGNVYVTDSRPSASTGNGALTVIDSSGVVVSNVTISGLANPFGISYDGNQNLLYVSGENSNTIVVYNPSNGQFIDHIAVGGSPYGISPEPGKNLVAVTNFASGTVSFLKYTGQVRNITFEETGLPSRTEWSINMSGTVQLTSANNIIFREPPGSYVYTASRISGYVLAENNITFNLTSNDLILHVKYEKLYNLNFTETGLPDGTPWAVEIGNVNFTSNGGTVNISEPNGTYDVSYSSSLNHTYGAYRTIVSVNGSNLTVKVEFYRLYLLSISEKGLFSGTTWTANVSGILYSSNGQTISIYAPNGTYSFTVQSVTGYALLGGNGNVVVNGSASSVLAVFSKLYTINFVEHGLVKGTTWSINFNGTSLNSSSGDISFNVTNGTYYYYAKVPEGYEQIGNSGTIVVSGHDITIDVYYSRLYRLTFTENGLPAGVGWSVVVGGHAIESKNNTLGLNLTNGTYRYNASQVPGFTVRDNTGNITVAGENDSVEFVYHKLYTIKFVESGLPSNSKWSVALNSSMRSNFSGPISFNETNGTYNFNVIQREGFISNISEGSVDVEGSNVTVYIAFNVVCNVTFHEENVPSGLFWTLMINGSSYGTDSSSISLALASGNYTFFASYLLYGQILKISGSVTLTGGSANYTLKFPHLDTVEFEETGLYGNATWSVNLTGYNITSSNSSILFYLPNGSYNFSISSSSGQNFHAMINYWGASGSSVSPMIDNQGSHGEQMPSVNVNGHNVSVDVHFDHTSEGGHRGHHGWLWDMGSFLSSIGHYLSYIGGVIKYAVTNMTFDLRYCYTHIPAILLF